VSLIPPEAEPGVAFHVHCLRCERPLAAPFDPCPHCLSEGVSVRGALRYEPVDGGAYPPGVRLPVVPDPLPPTPLRPSPRAAPDVGVSSLHYKDECGGRTWSWKDRLACVAVAHAVATGARTVVVSSSGNHGAAVAAAAAAAGLRAVVLTTASITPAMRRLIEGSGGTLVPVAEAPERWALMREAVREHGFYPASNFHDPPIGSGPFAAEGYKEIAWEIAVQLRRAPDWVVVPVGYGDGLAGIASGFVELAEAGLIERVPRMLAAETSGSLREALDAGRDQPLAFDVRAPSALSIACPQATYQALHAVRSTHGAAVVVDDAMALDARRRLGRLEGAFHELSSAVTFAAIELARNDRIIDACDVVVAVATSPGLKDQTLAGEDDELVALTATLSSLDAVLELDEGASAATR